MNKNNFLTVVLIFGAIVFGACSSTISTNAVSTANTNSVNAVNNIVNNAVVVNQPAVNAPVENVAVKPANTTANVKSPVKNAETLTADTSKNVKIGVAECDEYLEKYEACITSKVPEAERAALLPQLEMYRAGWQKAVTNQQAKAALPGGCTVALTTAKQTLSKYSCDW